LKAGRGKDHLSEIKPRKLSANRGSEKEQGRVIKTGLVRGEKRGKSGHESQHGKEMAGLGVGIEEGTTRFHQFVLGRRRECKSYEVTRKEKDIESNVQIGSISVQAIVSRKEPLIIIRRGKKGR